MSEKQKEKIRGAIPYSLGSMCTACSYTIISNLAYALTESFGMTAKIVGLIFLFSRVFDGFTDLAAGFLIDKTRSRWGKARPYELLYIPLWISLILCFTVPYNLASVGKVIWVFVTYNVCQSICYTFTSSIQSVRLRRSFKESVRVKVVTISTVFVTVCSAVTSIITPILISLFEDLPYGWTIIISIYAVPLVIGGVLRFLLLKEIEEDLPDPAETQKVTIRNALKALFQNKYAWIIALIAFIVAINNNLNTSIGNYYFKYVMGDVALATIPGLFVLVGMVFVVFMPKLSGKFGTQKTIIIGFSVSLIGCVLRFVGNQNLVVITLGMVMASVGVVYVGSMRDIGLTESMTYGEWKTGEKYESVYASVSGLADKLGLGIGSVLLGFILDFGGYDGALTVQPGSAITAIRFNFAVLPGILMLLGILVTLLYNLPKKMPQYQKELDERKDLVDNR